MRKPSVILGVCALLWGFLQAPFDHIHPNEDLEHESTGIPVHVHLHWTTDDTERYLAPRTADDDEIDVLWSIATSTDVAVEAAAEQGQYLARPELAGISEAVVAPEHRAHDPPSLSTQIPRGPPA